MRPIKLFLVTICLLFTWEVSAQDYIFRVMASRGDVKTNGSKVYPGSKLQKNARLSLATGAYLSLAHKNGNKVKIAKAGSYSISDLESKLAATQKSSNQRFKEFVIGELTKNDVNINDNYKKFQNVTGSVERAIGDNSDRIMVFLPPIEKVSLTYANEIPVNWFPREEAKGYQVKVEDGFEEALKEGETEQPSFQFDINEMLKKSEEINGMTDGKVFVKIQPKDDDSAISKRFCFKKLEGELRKSFEEHLSEFEAKYEENEKNSVSYLADKAEFFAQNQLYAEAVGFYQKAVELEPDMQEAYFKFLEDHKFYN